MDKCTKIVLILSLVAIVIMFLTMSSDLDMEIKGIIAILLIAGVSFSTRVTSRYLETRG